MVAYWTGHVPRRQSYMAICIPEYDVASPVPGDVGHATDIGPIGWCVDGREVLWLVESCGRDIRKQVNKSYQ